jgi:hypothetical protein
MGALAVLSLALGCSGDDDDDGTPSAGGTGGTPGVGGAGPTACLDDGQIVITDDSNYSFSSTLTIQSTVVKDATDLVFDWSALSVDFFDAPVNPSADIEMVLVSLWGQTETELAANINKDNLPIADNKGAITYYPESGETSANLLNFTIFGNELPEDELWSRFDTSYAGYQYPPETHTFMVMAASGVEPGKDSRMLGFFRLDPTSTNTTVALTNASTQMDWSVQLASKPQFPVPAGNPALTLDWTNMTVNALGNPYLGDQITEVVVAHYATMTLTDLEQQFLFLEDRADAWYSGEVYAGTTLDLSTLADANGAPFPGIDATGVWLAAAFCTSNCNNPAPWSITLLTPC